MLHRFRFRITTAGLALLGGCGASGASRSAGGETAPAGTVRDTVPAESSSDSIRWLVSDSAAKAAELSIVVTRPRGAESALLNGYRRGRRESSSRWAGPCAGTGAMPIPAHALVWW